MFKFICSRLIPTTHTPPSHVTLDRAILLYAMIEKKKVNARWIIYNNINTSVVPSKGRWILAKLYTHSRVSIDKNEEVKVGLTITAKASTEGPQI